MATESPPPPPPPPPPDVRLQIQYWCYHCEKRVLVESQPGQPDSLICSDCKFGFVESIPGSSFSPPPEDVAAAAGIGGVADEPTLGSQFLAVLRLLAQVAREEDAPPPPPPPPLPPQQQPDLDGAGVDPSQPDESDFLRIEIDGWDEENDNHNRNENEEDEDDDDDDDDDDVRSVEIEGESDNEGGDGDGDGDGDGGGGDREEDIRRRRRDVLRLRLRDFANRARSEGRNRILDWAEILMGLEDNSIEFRFELPETTDRYIGNPGDYVDAAEYEALLQNLADAEGRRGAPPASKEALDGLKVVEIKNVDESYVCAICKDGVNVGDIVKEMPCGHGYHGDCIVPWLGSRNSCPVCRFELPTDDAEYEEERKKKVNGSSSNGRSSSGGTSI